MSKNKNFWVIQRHTSNMNLLFSVAKYLINEYGKTIDNTKIKEILIFFQKNHLYNPRNEKVSNITLSAKINQLCYYMMGFKDNNGKQFIFSPLGKMYIDNYSNADTRNKIFLALLFIMQYPHPHSKTLSNVKIFPFRLIFKLLLEPRLNMMLYNYEIFMKIMKVQCINNEEYNKLVDELVCERDTNFNSYIEQELITNQETYVNTMYEWDYYTCKLLMFHDLLLISKIDNKKIELFHKTNKSYTKPTKRIYLKKEIRLNRSYFNYVQNLLNELVYDAKPVLLNDPNSLWNEKVREIYSVIPTTLLNDINKNDKVNTKILEIAKLLIYYADNPNNETAEMFENTIEEAMNLFYDVRAKKRGGPGNTDVECIFTAATNNIHKFNIDAKSTAKKLTLINAGRLKQHMHKTSAEYCIVVTPRYVPAAAFDILGENIVIATSSSISEYIYQGMIYNSRELSFNDLYSIIKSNLGLDISDKIYELSFKTFGNKLNL